MHDAHCSKRLVIPYDTKLSIRNGELYLANRHTHSLDVFDNVCTFFSLKVDVYVYKCNEVQSSGKFQSFRIK